MRSQLLRNSTGVVVMEFAITLIPLLLAFLGGLQFAFLAVAKLMVMHSANLAVRAAIVVVEESVDVPGTPENLYAGEVAGRIEAGGADPMASSGANMAALSPASVGAGPFEQLRGLLGGPSRSRSRLDQVRTAAYFSMLAISPDALAMRGNLSYAGGAEESSNGAEDDSVATALGDADYGRLAGALAYNQGMLAVTFPSGPGADAPHDSHYRRGEDITVRVSYLFRCRVPLVSVLMCDSGRSLLTGVDFGDLAARDDRALIGNPPESERKLRAWSSSANAADHASVAERVRRAQGARSDWTRVESPALQKLMLLSPGARFTLLQAEATLPAQSARYYPRG